MKKNALQFHGRLLVGLAVTVLLGTALPARAMDDDASIQKKIEARLLKAKLAQEGEIAVDVSGGKVTLTGAVTTVAAQREAVKQARKESKTVESRVQVLPEERPDADIRKAVRAAVLRYPNLTVFDSVEIGVENGVVLLQGSMQQPWKKDGVEDAITRIPGVREVRNEMSVQGLSSFDASLRGQLYRRIYGGGNAILSSFADVATPPVRIVVDNGKITLTGWVNSNVERQVIGNIARQTLAFDVDNRIKVDGEPPAADRQKKAPSVQGDSVEI
ncbi:MAG: BON domain-containing protein [Vicinamibacteria bacterium]